ncbi:MAG: tetratricopeptide repeat protein [Brevinematales bacterium]|nr:tetratricopeptide repeat protein [Brevinematales bacterium]
MQIENIINLALILFGLIIVTIFIIWIIRQFVQKDNSIISIKNAIRNKEYKQALQLAFLYTKNKQPFPIIYFYIAQCYEALFQYHKAIEYYEKVLVLKANEGKNVFTSDIHLKLGELYEFLKEKDIAMGYYKMVLDKFKFNSTALIRVANILFEKEQYLKAKNMLEVYLKIKPTDNKARYILAKIYNHEMTYFKAAHLINSIIETGKDSLMFFGFEIYELLANIYLRMKEHAKILNLLERFIIRKQYLEKALPLTILALLALGQKKQASEMLNECIEYFPISTRSEVLYQMGVKFFDAGEYYHALHLWKLAHQMDPSDSKLTKILDTHRALLNNPFLENIFTSDTHHLINYLIKIFHVASSNITDDTDIAIINLENSIGVVTKRPEPVTPGPFLNIEDVVKNLNNKKPVTLYTLYEVMETCKRYLFYSKITIVSGKEFLSFFSPKVISSMGDVKPKPGEIL